MGSAKLCYLLPEYSPDTDTHYYHLYELVEAVSRRLDLFLVIPRCSGSPKFPYAKGVFIARPALRLSDLIPILALIRSKGCRSFFVYRSPLVVLVSLLTRLLGGTTYYWHCGHVRDYFSPGWKWSLAHLRKKLFHDYRIAASLRSPHFLVTGSLDMADYYHQEFGVPRGRIVVMPNWVDLDRFDLAQYPKERLRVELGIPQGRPVVLFVHDLAPRKGAHHLARIAHMMMAEVPEALFLVVGDGPYRARLEGEIGEKGLGEKVRLVGAVPNREIMKYYAVADVFAMPSDEEGFPRVLLEAMAMGVPLVATHHPSLDYFLSPKQREFVVPRGDVELFAARLVDIIRSPRLRQELSEEGRQKVRDYGKERVVNRFLEIVTGGGEGAP